MALSPSKLTLATLQKQTENVKFAREETFGGFSNTVPKQHFFFELPCSFIEKHCVIWTLLNHADDDSIKDNASTMVQQSVITHLT